MKISRTYYIRNPKNLGKADAEFQASWGLKRKDDDIKYIRADQVKELVEACKAIQRAEPLWLPMYVDPHPQHIGEYEALHKLKNRIEQALKALEG